MTLILLIMLLMGAGVVAWLAAQWNTAIPKWIALMGVSVAFLVSLNLWLQSNPAADGAWMIRSSWPWIPAFGISFSVALDGLSLLMLLLTFFLAIVSVLSSWSEIKYRSGFYYFNLLWVVAGITGVFVTMDMFLFYFFWEVMLIPMYFLIGIWGHENKRYAAFKFFIFTQASGLLMLLAIVTLYLIHGSQTENYTYNYFELIGTELSPRMSWLLMLGFLAAFVVKLPVVPFHTWLPDAHSQAPTAGSVILAGLLLKTGAYGIIRFVLPLFPESARDFAPLGMMLGVAGIIYGAFLAFAQTDLKRLVAYTSVSHMGFVMLGVFALNDLAMQGVVMQMITHGLSTGALFLLAGSLYERTHTRDIGQMGGFWTQAPFMGTIGLIFVLASLGLPGLGNFVAEFLTLIGAWDANRPMTVIATLGLVAATAYSLRIMQRVFLGDRTPTQDVADLNVREKFIFIPMVVLIVSLGMYPKPVFDVVKKSITDAANRDDGVPVKSEPMLLKGGTHE